LEPPDVFIVSEDNTLWRKICPGGRPPDLHPDDPLKDGWSKLD
jgi:hypothetical protein